MRRFFGILTMVLFLAGHSMGAMALMQTTGPSGAPLPRFVSLSTEKAYMRTGPGRQYPIEWVYVRDGMPLEVVDEEGPWRQVRDPEGVKGWIHVSLLSSRRTALILDRMRSLYADPEAGAALRLTADPGVIGLVKACKGAWCQLEIDGTEAWIERRFLWGVYRDETID
ncbi:MAG: hypothetical protein EP335_02055 [Alphaproteobacteria bacterium]|nr:MAG: hypothetical protein EP335_02055 [Alphaproteobacteria bacterium]